jgi:hypothetical protein
MQCCRGGRVQHSVLCLCHHPWQGVGWVGDEGGAGSSGMPFMHPSVVACVRCKTQLVLVD